MDIQTLTIRFEAETPDDAYQLLVEAIQADGLDVQWTSTEPETFRERPDAPSDSGQEVTAI